MNRMNQPKIVVTVSNGVVIGVECSDQSAKCVVIQFDSDYPQESLERFEAQCLTGMYKLDFSVYKQGTEVNMVAVSDAMPPETSAAFQPEAKFDEPIAAVEDAKCPKCGGEFTIDDNERVCRPCGVVVE